MGYVRMTLKSLLTDPCANKARQWAKQEFKVGSILVQSQHPNGCSSKSAVTPVPGDTMPSSGIQGALHTCGTDIGNQYSHAHKIKINKYSWVWWLAPLIPAPGRQRSARSTE